MKPIIEAQTLASSIIMSFGVGETTVSAGKLNGAETVTFQLDEEGVGSLGDLYQNGVIRQLTATHNAMTIVGPIDLQITKSATAAAVGVYVKG